MAKTLEQAISERKRVLQNQYAYLAEKEDIAELKASHKKSENPYSHADELDRLNRPVSRFDGIDLVSRDKGKTHRRLGDSQIEQMVHDLHAQIWRRRKELFPSHETMDPVDMLDPIVAFGLLGYDVKVSGALGQHSESDKHLSNVAGIIDKSRRQVLLSSGFPVAVRNFTAAHELGHASMHDFVGMHRDIPLDGSVTAGDHQEREAQTFAAYFLMPEKLLRNVFEATFGAAPFVFNDDTRFALGGAMPSTTWRPKSLRDLSRLLSTAERFNGQSIRSLMSRFSVSREAMAIRLEQLGLVSFE